VPQISGVLKMEVNVLLRKKEITIDEFVDIARNVGSGCSAEIYLKPGDFALLPSILWPKHKLKLEKVKNINYLDKGDYETINGTFGPISTEVFIKSDGRILIGKRAYDNSYSAVNVCNRVLKERSQ